MNETLILNASPIISLGKADLLRTLSPVADKWIIPEGVIQEVEVKRSIEDYLSHLSSRAHVIRENVSMIHPSVAAWDLGQGESEVLTIALRKPETKVVLDDLQARKCANLFSIPLMGSLGLILSAKQKGLLPLARPGIERLLATGLYIDPGMITRILTVIGENG